jgi:hypothetical protein
MSAEESESQESRDLPQYVEGDNQRTKLGYDKGGVPLVVAIAWVTFLVAYVVYMLIYALPDLTAWGSL